MHSDGWTTAADRVKWLMASHYGGSRTRMAKETRVSMTGLIKVVTGQQSPGRRLLETIAANSPVNPAWLLTGEGQPLREAALPVASVCLPGQPSADSPFLPDARAPELTSLYSPSRYWLLLGRAEPAVRAAEPKLTAGDLMLLETDPRRFPPVEQMKGRWAAVRLPTRKGLSVKLAELSYFPGVDEDTGPARLEAETYATQAGKVQRRLIVDELPDGEFVVSRLTVKRENGGGSGAKTPRNSPELFEMPRTIQYDAIVAVCMLVVRQFGEVDR